MSEDHPVIEWDDLSDSDKAKAEGLLKELNLIFDKYVQKEDDSETLPSQEN